MMNKKIIIIIIKKIKKKRRIRTKKKRMYTQAMNVKKVYYANFGTLKFQKQFKQF